ncbi:MAG: polysulfide reductase NrfD [Actinomycetia bacterium]|nr:polysulfide reductase NrfD [Actinomycetes bacterium]
MTKLGFLLDSDGCIGCHACTVACKSEHDVPLGVNRTWLKYTETGEFPNTSRHFTVLRCNHCEDAPCVKICPTSALNRADNGVVDFNNDRCIGCKGCMNACPYDAIYINPETDTANKCNFCNHRIEVGLEPACVVVCPTHSIKVIDFDDADNAALKIIGRDDVAVRSPEQNTNPKVYYRGANQAALDPLRSHIPGDGLIWADTTPNHPTPPHVDAGVIARTTYTTGSHPLIWKEKVSGYLVTKAIAAGVMFVAALLVLLGHSGEQAAVGVVPPIVAGVFLALTGVLLVVDLKQPTRFHYLLTSGNRSSWLVKGAYILGAFAGFMALWWIAGLADAGGLLKVFAIPTALLAAGTAGYTAYLFAQCEGRDLWQSELLLPMLLAQAATAGGATFLILDLFMDLPEVAAIRWVTLAGIGAMALILFAELSGSHTRHVEMAVHAMTKGEYKSRFWTGVVLGMVVPVAVLVIVLASDMSNPVLAAFAGLAAIVGMWFYEDSYVRSGQSVPLS